MTVKAYPQTQKYNGSSIDHVTGQMTDHSRLAMDVTTRFATDISGSNKNPGANSTKSLIILAASGAEPGDMIRFLSGDNYLFEIGIKSVSGSNLVLNGQLPYDPQITDTFRIHRYITQAVDPSGSQIVIASPGPTQFVLDGVDTEVEEDTTNAANNKLLPVKEIFVQAFAGQYVDISGMTEAVSVPLVANVGTKPIRKLQIFYPAGVALYISANDGGNRVVTPPAGVNGAEFSFFCEAGSAISGICAVAPGTELAGAFLRINGWY